MSQSDYLRRKKIANVLNLDSSDDPIYDSTQYIHFKQFQLENEITSTNISYRKITPSAKQLIFNMERNVSNCPTFLLCNGTSSRPNRVAHVGRMCNDQPLNWNEQNTNENEKELWCKCKLNRTTTDENECLCAIGTR
jgi:hypothetical protein